MPLIAPAVGAALINAAGTAVGAAAQGKMNRKSRRWNEKMYAWQRNDALTDWKMQNEYNSPSAQMQRLKDAGLNPNLVYGNGAEATSGAMPRSSSVEGYSPRAYDYGQGASNIVGGYLDAQVKQQQVDNLQAQKTLLGQQALLAAAQITDTTARAAKTAQDTEIGKATLKRADDIAQSSLEMTRAGINKTLADTKYTLDNNERAALSNQMNLREAVERIASMRMGRKLTQAQTENTREDTWNKKIQGQVMSASESEIYQRIKSVEKDIKLKQLDIDLKSYGIQPGDPLYFRIVGRILEKMGL